MVSKESVYTNLLANAAPNILYVSQKSQQTKMKRKLMWWSKSVISHRFAAISKIAPNLRQFECERWWKAAIVEHIDCTDYFLQTLSHISFVVKVVNINKILA